MYYAEFNTDKVVMESFFQNNKNGIMVEVGAGPPEFYSMSKHFRDTGWRCICIDPNPKFVKQHTDAGNEIYQYACSNEERKGTFKIMEGFGWNAAHEGISHSALEFKYGYNGSFSEIEVSIIKLNTLLEKLSIDKIDFLSIDVEGWELEVMEGFDIKKYDPKVILLENYTHSPDYEKYMNSIGYQLHSNVEYNYIFYKK
jgi:FkbM family methyltransferase